jgi:hypothetical protein
MEVSDNHTVLMHADLPVRAFDVLELSAIKFPESVRVRAPVAGTLDQNTPLRLVISIDIALDIVDGDRNVVMTIGRQVCSI